MSSLKEQLTHPLICKQCGEVVCNTDNTDVEIQLAVQHLSKCKGKKNKSN